MSRYAFRLRKPSLQQRPAHPLLAPSLEGWMILVKTGSTCWPISFEIYENYTWKTEVLAASLRHPVHVIEAARLGADIATMPFKVIDQLFNHPLTDKGQAQFLADWAKSGRK